MSAGGTLVEQSPMETQPVPPRTGWFDWLPAWTPTSQELLEQAETRVLEGLRSDYRSVFVPIGPDQLIRTVIMEPDTPQSPEKTPLVMIHGFGAGLLSYYKNLDYLHGTRRLYTLDLPGFARSTRISFSKDAESVESEFVEAIEKWRQGVGLKQFVLLGHSMGAFLSSAYAMKYPDRVRHLILNDPWGFPVRSTNPEESTRRVPTWVAIIGSLLTIFNPLTSIRMAGPLGPYLQRRARPDLYRKFGDDFMEYVYHCNVQDPSGESAFFYMQIPFGWARRPMLERIGSELDSSVPITMLYGVRSWMDNSSGEKVAECRPTSYVKVHYVKRAGHHVHADQPEAFNDLVNETCDVVDSEEDLKGPAPVS